MFAALMAVAGPGAAASAAGTACAGASPCPYSSESQIGTLGDGVVRQPEGIATDGSGNVYVADTADNRIEKFVPGNGVPYAFSIEWGTFGTGNEQFDTPRGIAVDSSGQHVYVADYGNDRIVEYDSNGNYVRQFGNGTPYSNTSPSQLLDPTGLAIDPSGYVFVADADGNSGSSSNRIVEYDPSGVYVQSWSVHAGTGESGTGAVAVDGQGHVFVGDQTNHQIDEFSVTNGSSPSESLVQAWSLNGSSNANALPYGIAVDGNGYVYVTLDVSAAAIQVFHVSGSSATFVSQFGDRGTGDGEFYDAQALAVNSAGTRIFVADTANNRVDVLDNDNTAQTPATTFDTKFALPGPGNLVYPSVTPLSPPGGALTSASVAVAPNGTLYALDFWGDRVQIFDSSGQVQSVVTGSSGATDLAVDPSGSYVYLADTQAGRVEILDPSGNYVTQIQDYNNFQQPISVVVDSSGDVFVGDGASREVVEYAYNTDPNNPGFVYVKTFGTRGTGDGQISDPGYLALDPSGQNLYVADDWNNRIAVFNVASGQWVRNIEGDNTQGMHGLAIDKNGNLFVSGDNQAGNYESGVAELDSNGNLLTSWGGRGRGADQFMEPGKPAVDSADDVFVPDLVDQIIKRFNGVTPGGAGGGGTTTTTPTTTTPTTTSSGGSNGGSGSGSNGGSSGGTNGGSGSGSNGSQSTTTTPQILVAPPSNSSSGGSTVTNVGGPAVVKSPPTAINGCALAIQNGIGATLTGSVNPHGLPTTYWWTGSAGLGSTTYYTYPQTLVPTAPGDYPVAMFMNEILSDLPITYELHAKNADGEVDSKGAYYTDVFTSPNPFGITMDYANCANAGPSPDVATAAPDHTMLPASDPYDTTIHGTINPHSVPTVYMFEVKALSDPNTIWWSDPTQWNQPYLIYGEAVHHLSWDLNEYEGIGPYDRYYYQLLAVNRNGVFGGGWQQFQTPWLTCSICSGSTDTVYVPVDRSTIYAYVTVDPSIIGKAGDLASAAAKKKKAKHPLVLGTTHLQNVRAGDVAVRVPLSKAARRRLAHLHQRVIGGATMTIVITPPKGNTLKPVTLTRKVRVILQQPPKPKTKPKAKHHK